MKNIQINLGLILLLISICSACQNNPVEDLNKWLGWKDDNIAEEAVEFIIEKETGIDFDLTPNSKEK